MKNVLNYEEFLLNRKISIDMTKALYPDAIVCDPGDEIICDLCNADGMRSDGAVVVIDDYCLCEQCEKDQEKGECHD